MKKTAFKGGEVMVWINNVCYPLATSCQLNLTANMLDPETKDDGNNQSFDKDSRRWTVQLDVQYDKLRETIADLGGTIQQHSKLPVIIGKPSNYNKSGVTSAGWTKPTAQQAKWHGNVYLSGLTLGAQKGSKATIGVTMSGASDIAFASAGTSNLEPTE